MVNIAGFASDKLTLRMHWQSNHKSQKYNHKSNYKGLLQDNPRYTSRYNQLNIMRNHLNQHPLPLTARHLQENPNDQPTSLT